MNLKTPKGKEVANGAVQLLAGATGVMTTRGLTSLIPQPEQKHHAGLIKLLLAGVFGTGALAISGKDKLALGLQTGLGASAIDQLLGAIKNFAEYAKVNQKLDSTKAIQKFAMKALGLDCSCDVAATTVTEGVKGSRLRKLMLEQNSWMNQDEGVNIYAQKLAR